MSIKRRKTAVRIISFLITGMIAAGLSLPALAAGSVTEKEEVIYFNLAGDGSELSAYAVNIFNLEGSGNVKITDYGEYSEVKNLTSLSPISFADGVITSEGEADASRFYYQGNMKDAKMPWNISIKYYIDKKEYSAAEMSGKSGALEIVIDVKQNRDVNDTFFKNYALQATIALNTEKCRNINAHGATIANAGGDKQLAFTIMPNSEKTLTVTADVTDFSMAGIQFAGVSLSLGIEIPAVDEMTSQLSQLGDGAALLDDGAGELANGIGELADGTKKLTDGAKKLDEGFAELMKQLPSMKSGSTQIRSALEQMNAEMSKFVLDTTQLYELVNGSAQIKDGITALYDGLKQAKGGIDAYKKGLADNGVSQDDIIGYNKESIAGLEKQLEGLKTLKEFMKRQNPQADTSEFDMQISSLSQILQLINANTTLLEANNELIKGLDKGLTEITGGMGQLAGNYKKFDDGIKQIPPMIEELASNLPKFRDAIKLLAKNYRTFDNGLGQFSDGLGKLVEGYTSIYDGLVGISDGTVKLHEGALEFRKGTAELREGTADMDTQIEDQVGEMMSMLPSSDFEVVSFTSDKNENVSSVQFVIKSVAIEEPAVEQTSVKEIAKLNIWQKFLKLFGLYK